MVLLIIGAATAFGYALAILEAPAKLADMITSATSNPILVLLIVNVILLVLGTFMDMSPLIIISTLFLSSSFSLSSCSAAPRTGNS